MLIFLLLITYQNFTKIWDKKVLPAALVEDDIFKNGSSLGLEQQRIWLPFFLGHCPFNTLESTSTEYIFLYPNYNAHMFYIVSKSAISLAKIIFATLCLPLLQSFYWHSRLCLSVLHYPHHSITDLKSEFTFSNCNRNLPQLTL